eukprot:3294938-Ditylum_brightwellii.AAC.1
MMVQDLEADFPKGINIFVSCDIQLSLKRQLIDGAFAILAICVFIPGGIGVFTLWTADMFSQNSSGGNVILVVEYVDIALR